MEAKRLAANERFKAGDLEAAAELYRSALALYAETAAMPPTTTAAAVGAAVGGPQVALDEWTKSAGNLATCLHKLGKYDACIQEARAALRVNPLLAKCHAFQGMSLVDMAAAASPPSSTSSSIGGCNLQSSAWREDAHMHMCRALMLVPAMKDQLLPYMRRILVGLAASYGSTATTTTSEAVEAAASAPPTPADAAAASPLATVRSAAAGSGNGVFAVRDISRGTTLTSLLHPFSVSSYAETDGFGVCVACASPNAQIGSDAVGTRCPRCKRVWYCSEACSSQHAARHAEFECAAFQKLDEMVRLIEARQLDVPDDFADLAAHAITTRSAMRTKQPGYERVGALEHHAVQVSQSLHPISTLMQDLFPHDSLDSLTQLVGAVRCNALEVCDSTGLGIGQALHTVGITSFFNHSCTPNCAVDNANSTIRTIRTVVAGEHLTIAYIPQLYWPMALRREGLADRFFFTCRCARCEAAEQGADVMESICVATQPNAKPDATQYYHAVVQVLCGGIRGRMITDIDRSVLQELLETRREAARHLMPWHYLFQDLRNTLTFVYSVLDMPAEAYASSLEEVALWESIVPGMLPVKVDKLRNATLCLGSIASSSSGGGADGSTAAADGTVGVAAASGGGATLNHVSMLFAEYAALHGIIPSPP